MTFYKAIFGYCLVNLAGSLLIRQSLERFPKALCTNGEPASYYRSATKDLAKLRNVVIFLQPGGYCHNTYVCKMRCLVAPFMCEPPKQDQMENEHGILSDDPGVNPNFHHYYKVVIPYCSADMYVGRRDASEKTGGFSFLGRYILDAVVGSLQSSPGGMGDVINVILAGSSAGGAGVAFNCDYLKLFFPKAKIWCIVDGAFFYPVAEAFGFEQSCDTIDQVLSSGAIFWNARDILNFKLHATWWEDIQQQLFISSAAVDQFGFESYCGRERNKTEMAVWSRGTQYMAELVSGSYPHLGLFMPSCYDHMLLLDPDMFNAVPVGRNSASLSDTLGKWVSGLRGRAIQAWDRCDLDHVLCNRHCTNNLASYEDFQHV